MVVFGRNSINSSILTRLRSQQDSPNAAGSVARFSTGPDSIFETIRTLLKEAQEKQKKKASSGGTDYDPQDSISEPSRTALKTLQEKQKEKKASSGGTGYDPQDSISEPSRTALKTLQEKQKEKKPSSGGTGYDPQDSIPEAFRTTLKTLLEMHKEASSGGTGYDPLEKKFNLSGKHASGGQKPPAVSQHFPLKKTALSEIMNELKSVARPYPDLANSSDYHSREYLGQKLPMFESVAKVASHPGDLVFELRLDVWPIPDYWMLHGIWPCYIHKSGWIIYFCPDETIESALAEHRQEVLEEIRGLDPQIKKTLHKIWKSYSQYRRNAEAIDENFWAYQKIVHCPEDAGFPKGEYFNTVAKLGDAVRSTLLLWMLKSDIRPNHFYDSLVWREGMKDLYDADVHLVLKKDYVATSLTYLDGMGLLAKVDNNAESGLSLIDHPVAASRSTTGNPDSGKFFLLM